MRHALRVALVLCPLAALAQPAPARETVRVPALKRANVDGKLDELAAGLKLEATGDDAKLEARVGTLKDALVVGVRVEDDTLLPGDVLALELHFPTAGPTAGGYIFRFDSEGLRAPTAETPSFAARTLKSAHARHEKGLTVEARLPARALPRLPAKGPLVLELCVSYEDQDAFDRPPKKVSNCQAASMVGKALLLPDRLRPSFKPPPPARVQGLEGRPTGWLGYEALTFPRWVHGDSPLNAASLRSLVSPESKMTLEDARVAVTSPLATPDHRPLVPLLAGEDPFVSDERCDGARELRLALYLIKGRVAERVLEWPVATCSLGRALSIAQDDEGELTIGYSSGATLTFAWSDDHFERTEIGRR